MLNRDWRQGFAFGLGTGFLLTPLLIFAAILLGSAPNDFSSANSENKYGDEATPQDDRWWLISSVVYMDDTAAQWVMMLATIFAAYLLLRTLFATQLMARETTRIGEAQVRAYLTVEDVTVTPEIGNPKRVLSYLNFGVRNCGQSPAKKITVQASGDLFAADGHSVLQDLAANGSIPASVILTTRPDELVFVDTDQTKIMFRAHVVVRFSDVFAKTDDRTETPVDVVGIVHVIDGETAVLTNAGTALSDDYRAGH